MSTDFTYGGNQIVINGPIKPNGKDMPSDARTRVESYADIASIPNPHVGLKITVKVDETNNNKMTDYIVKSLKANSIGVANSLIDEVVRYVDYLGINGQSVDTNNFATKEELGLKADKTELHSHINKTVLDGIASTNVDNWNNKVDKVEGKTLTTNDYTNEEKQTVASLKATVGDTSSGLVKDVKDLKTNGVSQDNINVAIENYLTEHPVSGGATAEQAAQIQANKTAIGDSSSGLIKEVNDIKNTELQNLNTAILGVNETLGDKSGLPSGDANVIASINRIDSKIVVSAGGFTVKNLSASEISEILSAISVVVPVESIVASTNYLSINVGETRQITYNILPANATDKTVTYSSSDNSIVSVDQLGNIRALKEGDVLITITCSNGVSTDCQVVVSAVSEVVAVTGISLNKTSISMHTGDTLTLKATISPANATNKSVKWESSAPTVASIYNNGLVTALSDGSATITCTSLSNTNVSANCTIDITTTKVLTSVTNGLVHSYDLTALNGGSTTIEDLTGNVSLTMDGFSDVASAKTADGIVTEANSRLKQEAVSPTVTNEYSIVFTVKGERASSQGLLKCNQDSDRGKGFAISYSNSAAGNMTPLCMTHTGYLINGLYSTRDAFNYETITVTADYNNKEIKLYSGGYLLSTVSFDGFEWLNKAWFNDGYWGTKGGICYRNILMYNRILSGEEVATIVSEVCPSRVNTTNSPMVTANNKIITHINCNSALVDGTLPNLVAENYPLSSVASSSSDGFLVTAINTSYIKKFVSAKATYVVKLGTVPINSNVKRIISGLSNLITPTFDSYSYIKDSRFAARNSAQWIAAEQAVTLNEINVIMIESDIINRTTTVYFNNKQIGTKADFIWVFTGLENTEIPIKDFIIYDGIFNEETRTAIYNELIGGVN